MAFTKYRTQIERVWTKAGKGAYVEDSLLIRLLLTAIIAVRLFSLAELLKDARPAGSTWRQNVMEAYILVWLAGLSAFLFKAPAVCHWPGYFAAYLVAEVTLYRIYFLLVKGWDEPWERRKLRRSLVLALLTGCSGGNRLRRYVQNPRKHRQFKAIQTLHQYRQSLRKKIGDEPGEL